MTRTVEAIIDEDGSVQLLEEVKVTRRRRALVMILEEDPRPQRKEPALASETALARDWKRPEEDEGWAHLQPEA